MKTLITVTLFFFFFFFSLHSFGLAPAGPLQVLTPVSPNQSIEVALPLSTVGPVMKMEPLNNLQVTRSTCFVLKCHSYLLDLFCCFGCICVVIHLHSRHMVRDRLLA